MARLGAALARGPAFSAAWSQDLCRGTVAAVNDGATFPAASLVKLGLLAAVLARIDGDPLASPHAHDLRAMTTWSSNLATNRLLRRFGGPATAREGLRRLWATSSTFTGDYVVGTELQPALPRAGLSGVPPAVSGRVTTDRDMGRALYALHAAAAGVPAARRQTALSAPRARLAVGWLLASEQRAENVGLFAGGLPAGTAVAQKNGWLGSARHGAAIAYGPEGGRILVVLGYDPDWALSSRGPRPRGASRPGGGRLMSDQVVTRLPPARAAFVYD